MTTIPDPRLSFDMPEIQPQIEMQRRLYLLNHLKKDTLIAGLATALDRINPQDFDHIFKVMEEAETK